MPPMVVPLPSDQWAAAGAMMARAFGNDPQFRTLFPDDSTRPTVLLPFFRMAVRRALLGPEVVDATRRRPPWQSGHHPDPEAGLRRGP